MTTSTSQDELDTILDKLINDVLDYNERMVKAGSPVLFLGKYKGKAKSAILAHTQAATERAVIEARIDELDLFNKQYEPGRISIYSSEFEEYRNKRLTELDKQKGEK